MQTNSREPDPAGASVTRPPATPPPGTMVALLRELLHEIAHELSNPLTAVRGYAQLLVEQSSEDTRRALNRIDTQAERCQEAVRSFDQFIGAHSGTRSATDLADLARQVASECERVSVDVQVTVLPGPSAPVVADVAQLRYVLRSVFEALVPAARTWGTPVQVALMRTDGLGVLTAKAAAREGQQGVRARLGHRIPLTLSRAFLAEHAGSLAIDQSRSGELVVAVTLALAPSPAT